jgi:hypothetical protein
MVDMTAAALGAGRDEAAAALGAGTGPDETGLTGDFLGAAQLRRLVADNMTSRRLPAEVIRHRDAFRLGAPEGAARLKALASLYGWCRSIDAEKALRRTTRIHDVGTHCHVSDPFRLFRGTPWDHVLAVPFSDAPGRVRGFAFAGRGCGPEDLVRWRARSDRPEFGLAGLDALPQALGTADGAVVAVGDPFLMLRLQSRHLSATSSRPLPLLAWYEGPEGATEEAWAWLGDRKVVLWAWELTAAVVRQAAVADAYLVVSGPKAPGPEAADAFLKAEAPADRLVKLVRAAKPWREVLAAWGAKRGEKALGALLTSAVAEDAHGLFDRHDPRLSELALPPGKPEGFQTATLGLHSFTLYPDGRVEGRRTGGARPLDVAGLITDASMRVVTAVVTKTPSGNSVRLKGFVRYKGEDVPFEGGKSDIERNVFGFMERVLIDARKGLPVYDQSWSKRVMRIFLRFHSPNLVDAPVSDIRAKPGG